ncbi:zinc-dependent metalloprotease [Shewanella inventionis]|uniref:Periplasmic metalloprotease n=1 Tax=Shewanella inventionis TaxID=1738770 RepID=A0ABQ1IM51_9GAMM|nr:zinc-dependent metalloprotease [Shewanella inventionis]MCL1156562.1 zinc-dependent metalloprotease [Shewanella inventionis]UAL44255.1 zinc-dependent metalloprotease [Shewanella inventionis]GGB46488.1 periplasmic metalloprotease [Shewanella inventionis]
MMHRSISLACLLAIAPATLLSEAAIAASDPAQHIIKQAQAAKGFINLFYDKQAGQLYLEANKLNQPFLMLTSLPHGVGSNDIGLDRGQLGRTRMVQFEQHGPYLILKQLNTDYRASSENVAEQQAVTQAFAESILWRGKLVEGKNAIVAINDLVINDLHGVADVLESTKQGQYHLDSTRSVILPQGIKSFERNADVDVNLTFNAAKAGEQVAQVTPDGKFLSVRLRYSFIQLPDEGFEPRAYHPMSGYLSDQYIDYSTAVDQPLVQRHLLKHRLQKKVPGDAPSPVVKPIVYYLDPGVPEPIRGALLAGARWWEDAFSAAGFIDGFKVELLPEGADPQDVRYNMIQWVHRATRGWSYGAAVTDPRTGEIIKGNVTLGSLRVRQDHLIARGLTAGWPDREAASEAAMALSLARIRQLSAHEIGHTLGLDHNFAASTNDNASVMDYPHPYASIEAEKIDISQPYREGIGEWDKYTIAYGYGSAAQAQTLLASSLEKGFRYIGEADSRQASASHAYASLWDRGNDAVAELLRLESVRLKALNEFNSDALLTGEPNGELADVVVPIYLLTRYQIEAAAKWIGGTDYSYQQVGSGVRWSYVAPKKQFDALDGLLGSLQSSSLIMPANVLQVLVPKAGNYRKTRESFSSKLGVVIDPVTMAEMMSRHITTLLLTPERLNRVNQAYMEDRSQLSVVKLIDKLVAKSLYQELPNGRELAIQMRVNAVVVDAMLAAYHNVKTAPEVQAQLAARFDYIVKQLKRRSNRGSDYQSAHYDWLHKGIVTGLDNAKFRLINEPATMPPGSPI